MVRNVLKRRKTAVDEKSTKDMVRKFNALGDSTRFSLFKLLAKDRGKCVSELAQSVGISAAGASQQLKVLEQAGIIERERDGQKICYQLSEDEQTKDLISIIN